MEQLDFRKKLAKELIENEYFLKEKSRRSERKKAAISHEFMALPAYKNVSGTRIVNSQSRYPQATCVGGCGKKKRSYCKCTPGIIRCGQHFLDEEIINNSAE